MSLYGPVHETPHMIKESVKQFSTPFEDSLEMKHVSTMLCPFDLPIPS